MSKYSVRPEILMAVIEDLGETFHTVEVSDHPHCREAHPDLVAHSHYHAFVGGRLGMLRDEGYLERVSKKNRRGGHVGSLWRQIGSVRRDPVGVPHAPASPAPETGAPQAGTARAANGLGPQCPSDARFTARMRRHQSWYRSTVLRVPYGCGPTVRSTTPYGNMLTPVDGERGLNFLTPEAFAAAEARLADGEGVVERFRLLHNLLSSQPMCFNLFGPLVADRDRATRLLQRLWPEEVGRVRRVVIEWAPQPTCEYLSDGTAFDAFVEYERVAGGCGFLGIETKLTEPFSRKPYDGPEYRHWMETSPPIWTPVAAERVADIAHNQLWRDHLLAVALLRHHRSPYQAGAFVCVRHPEDRACAAVVRGYQELLVPEGHLFVDLPLDHVVGAFQDAASDAERHWLAAFHQRYLDLAASEATGSPR